MASTSELLNQTSQRVKKVKSTFELLKQATQRAPRIKSFDQLHIGNYIINSFQLRTTCYGIRLVVVLDDGDMFYLPPRFSDVINTEKQLNDLNCSKHVLLYRGKDAQQKNWIDVDFEEIPNLNENDEDDDDPKMKIDEDQHYKEYKKNDGQNIEAYLKSAQFDGYDTVDHI